MPSRGLIVAAFAAVYIIWGSTYLALRIAVHTLPPFLTAGTRYFIAGSILWAWAAHRGAPRPTVRQWASAALIGLLLIVGGNGLVTWSVQRIPSGLAALLIATLPLWIMLLRWALDGERPTRAAIFGLALGMLGLLILIGPSLQGRGGADGLGVALTLFGACSWAVGSVLARRIDLPRSAVHATGMEMTMGGVMQAILGLALGEAGRIDAAAFTPTAVVALAYLTFFGSLIGFTAYVWLLGAVSPAAASTYAFVNPVVALFLGWLVLDETMTARMIAASAITLVGVGFITLSTMPRTDKIVRETVEVAE